jgi:S-DNA-T family DNA segregation ATPase FtsK/SpoIIIE
MTKVLDIPLGINPSNETIHVDIKDFPHMLVAGTTGAGKTMYLTNMICSLLMKATPDDLQLMLVDSKQVEFPIYEDIPHLLCPVVTDAWEAIDNFQALVGLMESRYEAAKEFNTKTLDELNEKLSPHDKLPYIVVIVDEVSDLMMLSKYEIEESVTRIAQKSRAVGIHLILATQSPRREVITGLMKANLPSRLAFAVGSGLDSRIILDSMGAERLLGRGDALFSSQGKKPFRIQTPLIEKNEIEKLVSFWRDQSYWQERQAA